MGFAGGRDTNTEHYLRGLVTESLAIHLLPNAIFLAERLVALAATPDNVYLLAVCYFRNDQAYRAYHLLRDGAPGHEEQSPAARFLLAQCCLALDKLHEAERALTDAGGSEAPALGAAGHYLLGLVAKRTDRRDNATFHLSAALVADPFLWCAYDELCALGATDEAAALLRGAHAGVTHLAGGGGGGGGDDGTDVGDGCVTPAAGVAATGGARMTTRGGATTVWGGGTATKGPLATTAGSLMADLPTPTNLGGSPLSPTSFITPGPPTVATGAPPPPHRGAAGPGTVATAASAATAAASVGWALARGGAGNGLAAALSAAAAEADPESTAGTAAGGAAPQPRRKFLDEGKLRKISGALFAEAPIGVGGGAATAQRRTSARLSGLAAPAPTAAAPGASGAALYADMAARGAARRCAQAAAAAAAAAVAHPGTSVGAGAVHPAAMAGAPPPGYDAALGAAGVMALLLPLGDGHRLLCLHRGPEAVAALARLPPNQYATGWVLVAVGRAHAAAVDYPEAARAFERARRVAPDRVEGLDVYSTVLWHLRRAAELGALARAALALDRRSPEAWCAAGNAFSLQREHETALRLFGRARQLAPRCAYAHTLLGHEHLACEAFEKAAGCYRAALALDARHYTAWYGLGTVYFRQEKYPEAEFHLRQALMLHPRSSVLGCYLGMALHALSRHGEALAQLEAACLCDPRNPLARYEKAQVLMSLDRHADALTELEALKQAAPREATVYFAMGKAYKRLRMLDEALTHFAVALDLKPSNNDVNMIKSAIEKLHVPDGGDDEDL